MGHAYNYFFVHNRDPRFGLRMIPYQLLYASLIMPVLLKLFGWFCIQRMLRLNGIPAFYAGWKRP
jgi:hypothetical protein